MSEPRVLVLHNHYRVPGGEERAVELQLDALRRARVTHAALERNSGDAGQVRAARSMLRGGTAPEDVAAAARELLATVVHAHNVHPLFGHRALLAAREAGAATVLHLHNFRLFCSIAVAFRDGQTCFRCRGRRTAPGLVLNCRGSVPESAVYATALSLHQPAILGAADRFVTPSRFAADQLTRLGVPANRLDTIANYVPDAEIADSSQAADGEYALLMGRLSAEKGVEVAIEAAARADRRLLVVGHGQLADDLHALARSLGGPVELLGRVPRDRAHNLLAGAAMVLVPSLGPEVMPFAALEAMAAGVPVVASRTGSLPEVVGDERCVEPRDPVALAGAMERLFADRELRREEGDALIARVRERFSEERYTRELLGLYRDLTRSPLERSAA